MIYYSLNIVIFMYYIDDIALHDGLLFPIVTSYIINLGSSVGHIPWYHWYFIRSGCPGITESLAQCTWLPLNVSNVLSTSTKKCIYSLLNVFAKDME